MADRGLAASTPRAFYDELAYTYDLIYADWNASSRRQAAVLQRMLQAPPASRQRRLLDCACGIGTQLLGLAALGEHIVGTDISPTAVARARQEARHQRLDVHLAAADMQALPFADHSFDGLICADNSLPHLTTQADLDRALREMARVLRPGGDLLLSLRDYDLARRDRTTSTPPSVRQTAAGRVITFGLWHWHPDGEHYDLEHFQLLQHRDGRWDVRRRSVNYWALTQAQTDQALQAAGLHDIRWHQPPDSGFFQPVVTARTSRPARSRPA